MTFPIVDQCAGYSYAVVESPWGEDDEIGGFGIEFRDFVTGERDLLPMWFETEAAAQACINDELL